MTSTSFDREVPARPGPDPWARACGSSCPADGGMDLPMRKAVSRSTWIWLAILIAAMSVYGLGTTHEGFWYDESYSAAMAEHRIPEIVRLTGEDAHPPLYYFLLRCVRVILGNSEWALRLLSVIGAVAFVGLGAGPIRRMFGEGTSYTYAAVAFFTPAILIYAREARMYSLLMFTVTASALYGYLAVRDGSKRDWMCFGLSSLAAAYLHYYGAIAVFYVHLFLGVWLFGRRAKALKGLVITAVCVFVAYLPWMVFLAKQALGVRRGFWIPALDGRLILGACFVPFAYKDFYPGVPASIVIAGFTAMSVATGGAILSLIRKAGKELAFTALAAVVFLGTLLTGIVVSLVLAPAFFPRYMLACTGLVVVVVTLGISALPAKTLRLAAVGLFALLNLPVVKDVYVRHFNGLMREMASDFGDTVKPGDLIINLDSVAMGPSMYYFPDACHYFCVGRKEASWERTFKVFEPRLAYRESLRDLLSSRTAFWLITSNWQYSSNWKEVLKEAQGVWERVMPPAEYSSPYSRFAFTISRFTRVAEDAGSQ